MKSFSLKRTFALLCKEFAENRKALILRSVMVVGSMIIVNLLISTVIGEHYTYEYIDYDPLDPAWQGVAVFYVIAAYFASALSASFLFENMATKPQRLSALMLPASAFEKFISRFVIYVAGFVILFLISCVIAEVFRVAVFSCVYPDSERVRCIFNMSVLAYVGDLQWDAIATFAGVFLFCQSLFALGSAVWPKNSFIKTFGALWAIQIVFSLAISTVASVALEGNGNYSPDSDVIVAIMNGVLYLGTVANWIVAYMRFKESEIIQRM